VHHAAQLTQRGRHIGHLAERRDEVHGVECVIGVGQRRGVAAGGRDVGNAQVQRTAHRQRKHLLLQVKHGEPPALS
jgi:hypothetical protein